MNDKPTFRDLSENKQDLKSWVPPVVRNRLKDMADSEGLSLSRFTAGILSSAAFPEISPNVAILKYQKPEPPEERDGIPQFENKTQMAAWLIEQGIAHDEETAIAIVNLAQHHFGHKAETPHPAASDEAKDDQQGGN